MRPRWIPTLLACVVGLAAAGGARSEDAPAPATPTDDDLVAAVLFGSPDDVTRAAGWLRVLPADRVRDVLLRLRRAARPAAVAATDGRVSGSVTGGARVAGERVELRRTRPDAAAALRALLGDERPLTSAVDAAGAYTVHGVPAGAYEVVLRRGPLALGFADVVIARDEAARADVALDSTSLELRVAGLGADRTGSAAVVLAGSRPDRPARTCVVEVRSEAPVTVDGLPAGTWAWTAVLDLVTSPTVRGDVVRDRGARVDTALPAFGWISIQRADAGRGAPEPVVVESPDGSRHLLRTCDAQGRCRVAAPPGPWVVRRGPRTAPVPVEVRVGAVTDVIL